MIASVHHDCPEVGIYSTDAPEFKLIASYKIRSAKIGGSDELFIETFDFMPGEQQLVVATAEDPDGTSGDAFSYYVRVRTLAFPHQ